MVILGVLSTFLAFLCTILCSKAFYELLIKWRSERKLTKLKKQIDDIHYSFEELIYFVSLPNQNPDICNVNIDKFHAKPVYRSFIFPVNEGLMVSVNHHKENINIAFMALDSFRIPFLEKLHHQYKLNEKEYEDMRSYVLIHPRTRKSFIEEVYRQIRRDDRILLLDDPVDWI
ncbi:hypothetical protein [Salipaludibacillus keqinensis]|jgi:hypothetical protein|nr:hypothetical protein [Salipaludibacillus keqinensis]